MISINNLPQVNDPNARTTSFKYRIYLAEQPDVDFDKWPTAVKATIPNLPMNDGKGCCYVDLRANSLNPNATTEGEVAPQGKLELAAELAGLDETTLDWLYRNNGKYFVVIWEHCISGKKNIAGSPCSCLQLRYESLGKIDDYMGAQIKFVGEPCPQPFYFFTGDIPLPKDPEEENPEAVKIAAKTTK